MGVDGRVMFVRVKMYRMFGWDGYTMLGCVVMNMITSSML